MDSGSSSSSGDDESSESSEGESDPEVDPSVRYLVLKQCNLCHAAN